MQLEYCGLMNYAQALNLMEKTNHEVQHALLQGQQNYKSFERIFVVEHPPTVTMGNRELPGDLLLPPEELKFKGVAFHKVDRGGSLTVHEPGQIVIYPIVYLDSRTVSVRTFVHVLEQAMIDLCQEYGIQAQRDALNPGVWVGKNKIGALGIRVTNKVTKHGLAFNVSNTLQTFSHIVPCGLRDRGVTTLMGCLKDFSATEQKVSFATVEKKLAENVLRFLKEIFA
ncbi:MAG: lipoyl(octanoyl) transferase LipB [Silvanigrellaceae bacterium]|nr:lipoyl(octanoyl) transferase LipB [Silvanigrellaceae bacterium]